jgi:hypothetical protein
VEQAQAGETAEGLGHVGVGKWRRHTLARGQRGWCMLELASLEGTSWREGREGGACWRGQVEKAQAGERTEKLGRAGGSQWREAPAGERAERLVHVEGGKWRRHKQERGQRDWCMLEGVSGEGASW